MAPTSLSPAARFLSAIPSAEIAGKLGISARSVQLYKTGHRPGPRVRQRALEAYGLDASSWLPAPRLAEAAFCQAVFQAMRDYARALQAEAAQ